MLSAYSQISTILYIRISTYNSLYIVNMYVNTLYLKSRRNCKVKFSKASDKTAAVSRHSVVQEFEQLCSLMGLIKSCHEVNSQIWPKSIAQSWISYTIVDIMCTIIAKEYMRVHARTNRQISILTFYTSYYCTTTVIYELVLE